MHADEPIPVENEPFVQAVQYGIPFMRATRPSSHAVHDMDPLLLENVPAGHGMHGLVVESKNVPGAHTTQTDAPESE